ncbi:MAG: hypothetical protein VX730_08485 [Pseudomonadota bacterium]|nr:hypothetical protein [Pseudomonadota bacterium]
MTKVCEAFFALCDSISMGWFISFINSDFMIAAAGAAFGALGAALIIFQVEKNKDYKTLLQDTNMAATLLSGHIDTLIRLKRDGLSSFRSDLRSFKKEFRSLKQPVDEREILSIGLKYGNLSKFLQEIVTVVDIPVSSLARYADISTKPIEYISQANEIFNSIAYKVKHRNSLVQQAVQSESGLCEYYKMLLAGDKIAETQDFEARIEQDIDYCLCYMVEASIELQKVAHKALPKRYLGKVVSHLNKKVGAKEMPSVDFFDQTFHRGAYA